MKPFFSSRLEKHSGVLRKSNSIYEAAGDLRIPDAGGSGRARAGVGRACGGEMGLLPSAIPLLRKAFCTFTIRRRSVTAAAALRGLQTQATGRGAYASAASVTARNGKCPNLFSLVKYVFSSGLEKRCRIAYSIYDAAHLPRRRVAHLPQAPILSAAHPTAHP